jgi:signal transduction histidine kinase
MPDRFGHGRETVPETRERRPLVQENLQSLAPSPETVASGPASQPGPEIICPDDEGLGRQLVHAQALGACARELMASYDRDDAARSVLDRALDHLRAAADVDRASIFRNLEDSRVGPASVMVAESVATDVVPHMRAHGIPILDDPYPEALTPDDMLPWSGVPERNRRKLASGSAVGGSLEELFAERPDFLARLRTDTHPALSVQFFPIFCGDEWWGYVGFDDCRRVRVWEEAEVAMLRAGAELFSSTLQRWRAEAALTVRERYQRALAHFSHVLLATPTSPGQEPEILNQALAHLVTATQASRAYAIRSFDDPEFGPCVGIHAEACGPGVNPHIRNPVNQRIRWSQIPPRMRLALEAGEPYGGPVEQTWADAPLMRDAFLRQQLPLLSVQTVPIHLNDVLWGFIGFDQTLVPRRWTEYELMMLKTAAEMIGSALQRWQAEAQVVRAREELETRVAMRTSELSQRLAIERLLARIAARLASTDNPKAAIHETLSDVGAMTQTKRVLLVLRGRDGDASKPTLFEEWCAPGVAPSTQQTGQPLWDSAWVLAQLGSSRVTTIVRARQLPAEAGDFKQSLGVDEAESLILVPLFAQDLPRGVLVCVGIQEHSSEQALHVDLVEIVAGLLIGLLARDTYLRTLERQVSERTRALNVFLDMGLLVREERQLSESLELGLLKLIEAIGCKAGCIFIADGQKRELSLVAARGLTAGWRTRVQGVTHPGGLASWLTTLNSPLIVSSSTGAPGMPDALRLAAFPQMLLVQLRARSDVIGILCCYMKQDSELTIDRISLATAFGEQLGVIVQNYRLQQQAEKLAVVSERQRLARELHDAVTQSLYSQTLFARSAIDALEEGRLDRTQEHLRQVEDSASQALREMRVLLHQLRPPDLADKTLADAIEERLSLVERRVGIEANCAIDPDLELDEATEAALYRVILEALNNTLRHAEASQVDVQLHRAPDGLALFVIDDGRGFDPEDRLPGMGLNSVRERAAQLGGELHIDSQPGRGTALLLKVPTAGGPRRDRGKRPAQDSGSRTP